MLRNIIRTPTNLFSKFQINRKLHILPHKNIHKVYFTHNQDGNYVYRIEEIVPLKTYVYYDQVICAVSTKKICIEVRAPVSGYFYPIVKVGEEFECRTNIDYPIGIIKIKDKQRKN